jgi:hypothetical protein
MLVPVAAFVVTGLVTTLLWDHPLDPTLVAWQALILWPIGAMVLYVPVVILMGIRRQVLRRVGQGLVAIAGVIAMFATAASNDAQAGLLLLYAPILGSLAAGILVLIDRTVVAGPGGVLRR